DALGVGRPHGEAGAAHAVHDHLVGAELVVKLVVRAFVEKIDIVVGEETGVVAHEVIGLVYRSLYQDGLRGGAHGETPKLVSVGNRGFEKALAAHGRAWQGRNRSTKFC